MQKIIKIKLKMKKDRTQMEKNDYGQARSETRRHRRAIILMKEDKRLGVKEERLSCLNYYDGDEDN